MNPDPVLVYSNPDYWKELITFSPIKNMEVLDLNPFPDRRDMLTFAHLAYKENEELKNEILPADWQTLTTVRNQKNGYRAVVFWNEKNQLLVVAHRGTQPTNAGAVGVDIKGIFLNKYTQHMASAVTLVNEIKTIIFKANKLPGIQIRLSLTGHSLGAWLAEVTAFTVMYLQVENQVFCETEQGILAHTIVFDCPGSYEMLTLIKKDYGRYSSSMSLEKIDTEGYFIAANMINTCNLHVGRIFTIAKDRISNLAWDYISFSRFKNVTTHSLQNFIKAFDDGKEVRLVLDWPVGEHEKVNLHSQEKKSNNYNPVQSEGVRHRTVPYSGDSRYLSIFSEEEINFLNIWNSYNTNPSKSNNVEELFIKKGWGTVVDFLGTYIINESKREIECVNAEEMDKLVRRIKQLFRWYPEEVMKLLKQIELHTPGLVYRVLDRTCRQQLPSLHCDCQDTLDLMNFLTHHTQLFCIETDNTKLGAARILNILNQKFITFKNNCTFINWDSLRELRDEVEMDKLFINNDFTRDRLLIVDCFSVSDILLKTFTKFLELFKSVAQKKIILIFPKNVKNLHLLRVESDEVQFNNVEAFVLNDLTASSQVDVCSRVKVSSGGELASLKVYTGSSSETDRRLHPLINRILYNQVTDENYFIAIDNKLPSQLDSDVLCPWVRQEVSKERVKALLGREDVIILTSGNTLELEGSNFKYVSEFVENEFRQACLNHPSNVVYWIHSQDQQIELQRVYSQKFYIDRHFNTRYLVNIRKLIKQSHLDWFVFKDLEDQHSVISSLGLRGIDEELFINNLKLLSSSSGTADESIHYLRLEGRSLVWESSRGSLDGLRPYVTVDHSYSIDEYGLSQEERKVVIIADEPGMGKTTSLTTLALFIKSAWVIRLNLKDAEIQINELPSTIDITSLAKFLLPGEERELERALLQLCLESDKARKIHVLLDGFDEIRDDFKSEIKPVDKVLYLLSFIKNQTTARLIVTCRKHQKEVLENTLSVFSTTFEDLREQNQLESLVSFWRYHLLLMQEEPAQDWLNKCAQRIYTDAKKQLGPDVESLMGIPLQLRMLAEIFLPRIQGLEPSAELPEDALRIGSVCDLYKQFIMYRNNIYSEDKSIAAFELKAIKSNEIEYNHRVLGCQVLDPEFTEKYLTPFSAENDNLEELNEMNELGLIQTSSSGRIDFIHRTFAEFFFADLLVQWLKQTDSRFKYLPIAETFFTKFLIQQDFRVVRMFLGNLLKSETVTFNVNKLDLSLRDSEHRTAVHIAVSEGNPGIVNLLLEKIDFSNDSTASFLAARDVTGRTAFYAALEADKYDIIDSIINTINRGTYTSQLTILTGTVFGYVQPRKSNEKINYNIKPNIFTNKHISKLMCEKVLDKIQILLKEMDNFIEDAIDCEDDFKKKYFELDNNVERYYIPMGINSKGLSLINAVIENGRLGLIKLLINQDVLRSNDVEGKTPLICAVSTNGISQNEKKETVEYFIREGAIINSVDVYRRTALSYASASDVTDVIKMLIKAGANINIQDINSMTAFSHAAANGKLQVIKLLLNEETNSPIDRSRALSEAAGAGHLDVLKYLHNENVNLNSIGYHGKTSLFNAVRWRRWKTVKWFCENGADVRSRDWEGKEPLHHAVHYGCYEETRVLLEHGADVNCINKEGVTPLMSAAQKNRLELVELLLNHGALIENKHVNGKTALSHALICSKMQKLYLIIDKYDIDSIEASAEQSTYIKTVVKQQYDYINFHLSKSFLEDSEWSAEACLTMVTVIFIMHLKQKTTMIRFEKFLLQHHKSAFENLSFDLEAIRSQGERLLKYIIKCFVDKLNARVRIAMISRTFKLEYEIDDYLLSFDEDNSAITLSVKDDQTLIDLVVYLAKNTEEHVMYSLRNETLINDAIISSRENSFRGIVHLILLYLTPLDNGLIIAAKEGFKETVERLIRDGAQVNAVDDGVRTALHWAASLGYVDTVIALLYSGADRSLQDCEGKTPEDLARENRHHGICTDIQYWRKEHYV